MSWKLDLCCMAVDALQQKWTHMFRYAFPPFSLIGKVWRKTQEEKVTSILITPTWKSQPWYPWLLKMSIKNPTLLPAKKNLLMNPQGSTHPLIESGSLRLAAWLISSNGWRQREYLKRLQSSSQVPEGQVHKLVTNQPGISGLAGVQRQIHFFRCSIKSVTYFLADLFETGLEYRTLNFYRSIISAFHENGNSVPTGRHSLVFFLMKGIGYSLPLTTWYNFIWDIEQVLNYISSLPPNSKLSLKLLSLKLAMLLVLVATNRGSEIKNLDTNFLVKSKNKAVFSLKGFTKTSNPGKQPSDVIFYSFTGNEDLCPVKTLEFYLKVSESWRRKGDRSQLFLSFVKPYK